LIGYIGDGFYTYRSKDPTNSIKVLKEKRHKGKPRKKTKKYTYTYKKYTITIYTYKAKQFP